MGVRGFRHALTGFVPRWLSNRPGLNNGFNLLWTIGQQADMFMEAAIQGIRCWYPGYPVAPPGLVFVDATTALPLAGRSRGLVQGPLEADAVFAQRLINWRTSWANAGSDEELVKEIQAYLKDTVSGVLARPAPIVRVVNRAGFWTSIDQYGNITHAQAALNWDSTSAPQRIGWWGDVWIFICPAVVFGNAYYPITGTDLAALDGVWGTYDSFGLGQQVPREQVDDILGIVETWKGAHAWVEGIVWSGDHSMFDPSNMSALGNPDGTWAYWGKLVAGALEPTRIGSSQGSVRVWTPYDKNYPGLAGSFPTSVWTIDTPDAPCGSNLSISLQGGADRTAYLYNRIPHIEQNWRSLFTPAEVAGGASFAYFSSAAWDPQLMAFVVGVTGDNILITGTKVFASFGQDDGDQWVQIGSGFVTTSASMVVGVCADPVTPGTYWAAVLVGTARPCEVQIYKSTAISPAWTKKLDLDASGLYTNCAILPFRGRIVIAVGSSTATNGQLASTVDGGSTWQTFTIPSSVNLLPESWTLASSPTTIVAVAFNEPYYYTSADGVVWTQQSAAVFLGTGTDRLLQTVIWDDKRSRWFAVVTTGVPDGPLGQIYFVSTDGVNWARLGAAGPTGLSEAVDMSACGNGYAVAQAETGTGGPGGQVFSVDGGATWYASQAWLPSNLSPVLFPYTHSKFAAPGWTDALQAPARPPGYLVFNSSWARFSDLAQLPPAL